MENNGDIKVLHAVRRNRSRHGEPTKGWFTQHIETNGRATELHLWVDEYTTGRFHLVPGMIAFEDEKDYVIFSLWYKNK